MELLIFAAIWLFLAPIIILFKTSNMEERLKSDIGERIRESESCLKQFIEESMNKIQQRMEETEAPQPQEKAEALTSAVLMKAETLDSVVLMEAEALDSVVLIEPAPSLEPSAPVVSATEPVTIHEEEPAVIRVGLSQNAEYSYADGALPETPIEQEESQEQMESSEDAKEYIRDYETPEIIKKLLTWLLSEGNIWVCAGVLLLLTGFGLLLRYAISIGFLTLEMRLAAAALTGIIITMVGFRLRKQRRTYALILQGGGMGVLYLAVLGAAKLIPASADLPVLSPLVAVFSMLALSVFTVLLALLQNYQPLAVFAILGGFAAPILIGAYHDHMLLFSIYTLLNLEILAISFKREWLVLNYMGFVLTVAIGAVWGFHNWKPELFSSIEPFLLTFLATYTIISLNSEKGRRNLDENELAERIPYLFLSLSTPFAFFFFQMKVIAHFRYGMAITCLGLGLLHLMLGALLRRKGGADGEFNSSNSRRNLSRLHMLLCILFSNLAIPFSFENNISSVIWAVEGAFLIAAACRYGDYRILTGGIVLHAGAIWLYAQEYTRLSQDMSSRLSPLFISGVLFAASHLVSGFYTSRFHPAESQALKKREETLKEFWSLDSGFKLDGKWIRIVFSWAFTVLGSLWWLRVIYDQVPRLGLPWFTAFSVMCLTTLAGCWMSTRFNWKAAKFPLFLTVLLAFAWDVFRMIGLYNLSNLRFTYTIFFPRVNPAVWWNASLVRWIDTASYLVGIGSSLYLLRRAAPTFISKAILFFSVFVGLTLSAQAAYCFGFLLNDARIWGHLFFALPFLSLLLWVRGKLTTNRIFNDYKSPLAYSTGAFLLLQARDFCISFLSEGAAVKGLFIPFLNPLEIWQAVFIVSLILWVQIFVFNGCSFEKWAKQAKIGIATLSFIWINQVAARMTFWYWDAPPYDLWRVFITPHCQAAIAIIWGVIGLCAILRGKKRRSRVMWSVGAGLLAVDMIKLLMLDLRGAATLTRVLAFIVLGGLFILIGWAAPLPPKEEEQKP